MTRIFFATDVHGSEKCWKKFIAAGGFYKANLSILGGDMTGKAIIPIVELDDKTYRTTFLEQEFQLKTKEELDNMQRVIVDSGYYPYLTNQSDLDELGAHPEKVDEIFKHMMLERVQAWMNYADERLKKLNMKTYVCPGNDDSFDIDKVIESSQTVVHTEGKVVSIDEHHEMISSGWSNPTPWKTFRECSEGELGRKLAGIISNVKDMKNCIFNMHVPPSGSGLDEAPELDQNLKPKYGGQVLISVGSTAVRELVMKHQPLLGLHGHIHEGKGAFNLGRTLCINPGSSYEQGVLLGAVIDIEWDKVKRYVMTTG